MPKKGDKYYLSPEIKRLVDKACKALGLTPSEFTRMAVMNYLKDVSLITEAVHKGNKHL